MPWQGCIFIDGDSCPRQVRELILRTADRRSLRVVLVSDRPLPAGSIPGVTCVVVPRQEDAADSYIQEHAQPGDLIITQDIPLAARLVEDDRLVLNHLGVEYTRENVQARLLQRNTMAEMRLLGLAGEGGRRFGARELKGFADAFDRILTRLNHPNK
ncbi:YaiI/YqxD family protein [Spirochaeta lutea]|uniref:UPF0178 protein DC28_07245 n=1 Tax=Spirochaeta lutea TaxID=1480694 RepID=A0A098R147_9SPIO|nr:DUF188 domain-containing protein [Spirochaeta lutea]KGE72442.1 hypothetical protein DC28_07245 [Spirochaeta lutea]